MRGQQWLFSGKTKIQEKNKPISKKPKDQGKQKMQTLQSFQFKKRKISMATALSLQNFRTKLWQIYQTCKFYRLSQNIFIMSIKMLKALHIKNPLMKLTSVQTLTCLNISIKFQSLHHRDLIKTIVNKSKIANSQLLGGQIHVLQTLKFKLPVINRFQENLSTTISEWNNYVSSKHPDKSKNLCMDKNSHQTCQSFHNHVNLIVMTNFILTLPEDDAQTKDQNIQYQENIEQCMNLALYFVVYHSASQIYIHTDFRQVVKEYWKIKHQPDKSKLWQNMLEKIMKQEWQGSLERLSVEDYRRIKHESPIYRTL